MQTIRIDNTSGITGVTWDKRNRLWQSCIFVNKLRINLGSFKDLIDAVSVRKEAEQRYHQEIQQSPHILKPWLKKYPTYEARVKAKAVRKRKRDIQRQLTDPSKSYLMSLKDRVTTKGCKFTFDISNTLLPTHCEVCGTLMRFFHKPLKPDSISADRLDPLSTEYGPRTVRFICWQCNRLKSNCDNPELLRLIADYIDRHKSKPFPH